MWVLLFIHFTNSVVGLPVPIVVLSAAISHDNYGIKDDNGETIA